MPATRCDHIQRRHHPRHQRQRYSQVAAALPGSVSSEALPAFVPLRAAPKRQTETSVIIVGVLSHDLAVHWLTR